MLFEPFDPNAETAGFRRKLPHWRQSASTYFVTWRLADSLPQEKLRDWVAERDRWLRARGLAAPDEIGQLSPKDRHEFENYFGTKLEVWLDAGYGSCCLALPAAAKAVESALRYFDGDRYALGEFVVMPNHVHLLVTPAADWDLSKLLHAWKSYSANEVNKLLGRKGTLWQAESFNHIVRSEAHLRHFERYICENPEKAGLAIGCYRLGCGRGLSETPAPAGGRAQQDRLEAYPTLGRLTLRHFRCFEQFETEFAPGTNFIVGPNARGKTSLIEAACILLRLQSPRITQLARVVQHGRRGFVTDGFHGARHMQFYYSPQRKKLALDGVEQTNAKEWLQIARVVWFGNDDIEVVRGASDKRRRFLDFIGMQRDAGYRASLRSFEHALRSRNHLLKQPSPRWREIAAFDQPLIEHGNYVSAARRQLLGELQADADAAHFSISGKRESLRLEYAAGDCGDFAAALSAAQREDARLRQTTVGPHRDDVHFFLNDLSDDDASEGQQRTLVLALKLGAARLLERHFGSPPLLLLDDIFGELDPVRRNALLAALPENGQRIITTTHLDWMPDAHEARILKLGP
jgi:DNA replication and repair protein RecF